MGTPTYTPLAEITVTGTPSSVTFSSISGLYRDLVFRIRVGTSGSTDILYQFNSDTTAANYPSVLMQGDGTSTFSGTASNNRIVSSSTAGDLTASLQIMDYSVTNKHKSLLIRGDTASIKTYAFAGRWANTSAVTQVVFTPASGTFATGSTFALYGIAS